MKWMQFLTPVKSIDFSRTQSYISQHPGEEITILDVRQPSEYQESHIPGATLIPLPQLADRLGEIDPEKPTLVY
jgi:sulfur-carrier protein adenylyltransferase/sulfurtransferase